jgi:hypothetical protein
METMADVYQFFTSRCQAVKEYVETGSKEGQDQKNHYQRRAQAKPV